tara:strand:+ start:1173 stop:1553 length:381 start_codon:yes stop_codon:yes gene_type:complete
MNNFSYHDQVINFDSIIFCDPIHLKILTRTKRYIDVNFSNTINLKNLALSQGTSSHNLMKLFKFYLGLSPKQYQINRRIQKAKLNLLNGLKVSDSCYDVGFNSVTTFSKLFKRKAGMTPRQFKKNK